MPTSTLRSATSLADDDAVRLLPPQEAIELLFNRHQSNLLRQTRSRLDSHEDAEDALQNMWLRVFGTMHPGMGARGTMRSYLSVAARNAVFDLYRKRRDEVGLDIAEHIASSSPTPDEVIGARELFAVIIDEIRNSEERERVIAMLNLDGVPGREIASIVGVSEGNQRVIFHRFVKRCRVAAGLTSLAA